MLKQMDNEKLFTLTLRDPFSMGIFVLCAFLVPHVPVGWCWVLSAMVYRWLLSLRRGGWCLCRGVPGAARMLSLGAARRAGPLWGALSAFIL